MSGAGKHGRLRIFPLPLGIERPVA